MKKQSRGNKPTSPSRQKKEDESKIRATNDALLEKLEKLPAKHDKALEALKAAQTQGERLLGGSKTTKQSKEKMLALYQTAQKQCDTERKALQQIFSLSLEKLRNLSARDLVNFSSENVKYFWRFRSMHSALCIIHSLFLVPHTSIKLEVVSPSRYEVRDIDDENCPKQYILPPSRLIALPHYRADPRRDAHALFPQDAVVLALYPQTTCFYKGVVDTTPAGPSDDYFIAFEDDTFPSGYSPTLPVPQRYVLTFREMPTKSRSRK
ncbi:SGF29 tudor-like domain-containing protein [Ditylenchus destructor]|nr:SGF29 tudor-like domain-containing protein [Ditylenchus destructor]